MPAPALQPAPRPAAQRKPAALAPTPADLAEIEAILSTLQSEYDGLARIARAHRAALSSADRAAVERCADAQREAAARLAPLDARRGAWAARVAAPQNLPPTAPLSALVAAAAEPARGRVLQAAARLREVGEAVQEQNRTIRMASEALLAHMKGMMAQVARTLSHTGVYARPNTHTTQQVVSSLDLRS